MMSCPPVGYAKHSMRMPAGQRAHDGICTLNRGAPNLIVNGHGKHMAPEGANDQGQALDGVDQGGARWTAPDGRYPATVRREGYTAFPNALLTRYARLGITEAELVLVQQIWVFWWDANLPYPAVATLAARMGKTVRQIQRLLQRLRAAELITIVARRDPLGGQISNAYDLTPLVRAVERLIASEAPPGRRSGTSQTTRGSERLGQGTPAVSLLPLTLRSDKGNPPQPDSPSISISIPPSPPKRQAEPTRVRAVRPQEQADDLGKGPGNPGSAAAVPRPDCEGGRGQASLKQCWDEPSGCRLGQDTAPKGITTGGSLAVREVMQRVSEVLGDSAPRSSLTRVLRLGADVRLGEEALARIIAGVAARVTPLLPSVQHQSPRGGPNAMPYFLASLAAELTEPPRDRRRGADDAANPRALAPAPPPETSPPCAEPDVPAIWAETREALRGLLAPPVHARHVQPLSAHLDEGGVLVLEAPTAFEASWISSRLGRHISDILAGRQEPVAFRVEVRPDK